jgi:hypothetical protein
LFAGADEAGSFEDLEMLHGGGERELERVGQGADGDGTGADALEEAQAGGVSEGVEDLGGLNGRL